MAGRQRRLDADVLVQTALFVLVLTAALTATFLGLVALATGTVAGIDGRLPFYVFSMALAFVGSLITFEQEFATGREVLETSLVVAVVGFVAVALAGEGVAYTLQAPRAVVSSDLVFYVVAAALMGSGLAYWALTYGEDVLGATDRL